MSPAEAQALAQQRGIQAFPVDPLQPKSGHKKQRRQQEEEEVEE